MYMKYDEHIYGIWNILIPAIASIGSAIIGSSGDKKEKEQTTTQQPIKTYQAIQEKNDIGTFDKYIPVTLILITMIATIGIVAKGR